jgi:hypothetical protein
MGKPRSWQRCPALEENPVSLPLHRELGYPDLEGEFAGMTMKRVESEQPENDKQLPLMLPHASSSR